MDPIERKAVLLDLIDRLKRNECWCGETHIQKSVYFLQEMLEVPLDFNIIFYKHGPFSFEVSDELTALIADRGLEVEPRQQYGPGLLPIRRTVELYRSLRPDSQKYGDNSQFIADRLSKKTVKELERLATALYVLNQGGRNDEALAQEINRLKPHVPISEAKDAVGEVRRMQSEWHEFRGKSLSLNENVRQAIQRNGHCPSVAVETDWYY